MAFRQPRDNPFQNRFEGRPVRGRCDRLRIRPIPRAQKRHILADRALSVAVPEVEVCSNADRADQFSPPPPGED